MSLTANASGPSRGLPGRSRVRSVLGSLAGASLTDACLAAALPLLWMLGHGYAGIDGDGRIYMGRVLADLDPGGVGRDLMFALDGQSSFTLFSPLATGLATALGLGPTVLLLTLASSAAWFGGASTLARAVAPGRGALLVVAVICLLPRIYTPPSWHLLSAGEALPVPRPLAEACVLFALAALVRGRLLVSTGWLVAAALFHPIMAAPGFGVLLAALGRRDRRWLIGCAALAAMLVGASLAGLPFLARVTARVDPVWLALLRERNPYLFLRSWPADWVGLAVVQTVTILIGSQALPVPARATFIASLAIGFGGCILSFVGGDLVGSELVLQAQPWRALWLPAALAPLAAGLCLRDLPARGPAGLVALSALGLAWIAADEMPLGPAAALAGAAALYGIPRSSSSIGRPGVFAAIAGCVILAAVVELPAVTAVRAVLAEAPPDIHVACNAVWRLGLPMLPLLTLSYLLWRWPRHRLARLAAPTLVAAGSIVLATGWDLRSPAKADADAGHVAPELVTLLAARPGPVLWTEGDDVWYRARRPNWIGQTQGGGLVFSRALATRWRERADAAIAAGLQTSWLLHPWSDPMPSAAPHLDPARIAVFCGRADAPGSIVAPLASGAAPPPELRAAIWRPRLIPWKFVVETDGVQWQRLDRYAVIPCASGRTARAEAVGGAAIPAR